MGKGGRDSIDKNNVPGPGSYEQFSKNPKEGKVTFSKDIKLKSDVNKNPGPGNYDLKPTFADVPKYLLPNKP